MTEMLRDKIMTPKEFLLWLSADGPWVLTAIIPDGAVTTKRFTDVDKAVKWAKVQNKKAGIYYALNPLRPGYKANKKASKADVAAMAFLHVDVDPAPGKPIDAERARGLKSLQDFSPPPTMIIDSGGGFQGLWCLDKPEPVSEDWPVDRLESYNVQLENLLSADRCHNLDRIMRLPGFINHPNAKKRAAGRVARQASIVALSDHSYPLDAFEAATEAPTAPSDPGPGAEDLPGDLPAVDVDALTIPRPTKDLIRSGDASQWDGGRSDLIYKVAVDMCRGGHDRVTICAVLLDPGLRVSAHCLGQANPRRAAMRTADNARRAFEKDFELTKSKKPDPRSPHNIDLALTKLNIALSFDTLSRALCVNDELKEHADSFIKDTRILIRRQFEFLPASDFFHDTLYQSARLHSFDPVLNYLDGLTWDNTPRVDTWLRDYLGAEDTPLIREFGKLWLMAAVSRVLWPGIKFDQMLVLEGAQGSEKSGAVEALAGPEWYTDQLPFKDDAKILMERTGGKWIVEFGELSGIKKGDVDALKVMLAKTFDECRMAYDRGPSKQYRRIVFVGTTNDDRYLRDRTGNRRYWPVKTGRINLPDLSRDRDQIWAEVYQIVRREVRGDPNKLVLPRALWDAAAVLQAEVTHTEGYELFIEEVAEIIKADDASRTKAGEPIRSFKVRSSDLRKAIHDGTGRHPDSYTQTQVGGYMRRGGLTHGKASFGGHKQNAYIRKGDGIAVVIKFAPAFSSTNAGQTEGYFSVSVTVDTAK